MNTDLTTSVGTGVVSIKEISEHPTMRMDAAYWIARKNAEKKT